MSFSPYLGFPGTCREAMTAYARILGATDLEIMSFGEAPPEARPSGGADRVMHSQLSAGPGAPLMAADWPEGMPAPSGARGVSVYHAAPDAARARAVFDALSEGGRVSMPFQATFWSEGLGAVTDRWGTAWMISVAAPQATRPTAELARGGA